MLIQLIQNSKVIHSEKASPSDTPLLSPNDPTGTKFEKIHEGIKGWNFGDIQNRTNLKAKVIDQVDFNIDTETMTVTFVDGNQITVQIDPKLLAKARTGQKRLVDLVAQSAYSLLLTKENVSPKPQDKLLNLEYTIERQNRIEEFYQKYKDIKKEKKILSREQKNLKKKMETLSTSLTEVADECGKTNIPDDELRRRIREITNINPDNISQQIKNNRKKIRVFRKEEKKLKRELETLQKLQAKDMDIDKAIEAQSKILKSDKDRWLDVYAAQYQEIMSRPPLTPENKEIHNLSKEIVNLEKKMERIQSKLESRKLKSEKRELLEAEFDELAALHQDLFLNHIVPLINPPKR